MLPFIPSVDFYIRFFSSHANIVAFTVSVTGERVTRGGQAAMAFLVLVFVYVLIIFEVRNGSASLKKGEGFWILQFFHKPSHPVK